MSQGSEKSIPRTGIAEPGTTARDPHDIIDIRRQALIKAHESGVAVLKPAESQWLGQEARIAAETGTHEIPDVVAHQASQAAQSGEQAASDQANPHAA